MESIMKIKLNALNQTRLGTNLTALAALLLAGCGGGGPAITANSQTISFVTAPALTLYGHATVSATASSGLAVSYSSSAPGVCSVDSSTGLVTDIAAGTCIIAANQAGNSEFAPAAQATQSIPVIINPNQTITFGAAPSLSLYGHGVVSATASSGLAVSYSSTTPAVCFVNSGTGEVSDLTTGDCIIAADRGSDAYHNAAPQVTQTLKVAAWSGSITVPDAPGGVAATMGNTPDTITVSFMGSISSGGSPITGYTVISNPSGLTATSTASPITVTCPSTCTGYAFSVFATNNAVGDGASSAPVDVVTHYNVMEVFLEPMTQPNDSIFLGAFTLDSTTGTVSNLHGILSESMTGGATGYPNDTMTWLTLNYQLSAVSDGQGGLLITTFALNTTNTFSEGGFAPGSQGLYYGFPTATNPAAGGIGNAYAMIYVNLANPTAALTTTQINQLAYADCTAGGMMGDICMTGFSGKGTMGGYPVSQVISR
jgi:hypothetical protein